jgi:Protein of unknown function (DUF3570)
VICCGKTRLLALAPLLAASATASAGGLGEGLLDRPRAFEIESVRVRFTHFDQMGWGYQSAAGPPRGPGSEELTVEQPQLEVVARQGQLTHRVWVPLDVVTAASPDALDALTSASRTNEAGSIDLSTAYQADRATSAFIRAAFHIEEPYRSYLLGGGASRSFADDNAVFAASASQAFDWFDTFDIHGARIGHAERSTTNANLALSQLLSPTTVAHVNYGFTLQTGALGNTWNSVPLDDGKRGEEILPTLRHRHAAVVRLAQWLPWNGALKALYRFYADNWGIVAHTLEAELYQRLSDAVYVRLSYRLHVQSGADFFKTSAPLGDSLRTADSDLAPFVAHTFGAKVALHPRFRGRLRGATFDVGAERYVRSNQLHAIILSTSFGRRF